MADVSSENPEKVASPASESEQARQKLSNDALASPAAKPPEQVKAPVAAPAKDSPLAGDSKASTDNLPGYDIENNPSGPVAPQNRAERDAAERKYFQFQFDKKNLLLDPFQPGEGPFQVLSRMNQEHKLDKAVPYSGVRRGAWTEEQIQDAASRISHRDLHGKKESYRVGEQTPLWSAKDISKQVDKVMSLPRGLDVSHLDGEIDWAKVKEGGIDFTFLKTTGAKRNGTVVVDDKFEQNYAGATAAGLEVGFYHYFRADIPVQTQVELFAQTVGKVDSKTHPLVLDVEEDDVKPNWKSAPDGHEYSAAERVKIVNDFCDGVKKILGKDTPIMLYTSAKFVNENLNNDKSLAKYSLWDANWKVPQPNIPKPWTKSDVWQYAGDNGKVAGINREGGVDLDMAVNPNFFKQLKHKH